MTYEKLLSEVKKISPGDFRAESMLILTSLFGVAPAYVMAHPERDYGEEKITEVLRRRKNGEPIQYILGKQEFMGLEFSVSPACLIPRQDTEVLAERAIKEAKCGYDIADFCTGSGCIGISVLKMTDAKRMLFADISCGALEIARKNAASNGVIDRADFLQTDIMKELPDKKFDMILSNPPYIPTADIEKLSHEVKSEPKIALDGGGDGLDFVKRLVFDYIAYLKKDGVMLIEFGYDQGKKISDIAKKARTSGLISSFEIIKDYGGNDRVLAVRK